MLGNVLPGEQNGIRTENAQPIIEGPCCASDETARISTSLFYRFSAPASPHE